MKLEEPEYWDKPYKCKICNIRFENIQDQQKHIQEHRLGICPMCKKVGLIEDHHFSYEDFELDKKKNTMKICNKCHGYQTLVQKFTRLGLKITYIGHLLNIHPKPDYFENLSSYIPNNNVY